jgi:hypothetical protein
VEEFEVAIGADLAKLFSEDEERLFDRSKLQRFLVDERITSFDRKSVA